MEQEKIDQTRKKIQVLITKSNFDYKKEGYSQESSNNQTTKKMMLPVWISWICTGRRYVSPIYDNKAKFIMFLKSPLIMLIGVVFVGIVGYNLLNKTDYNGNKIIKSKIEKIADDQKSNDKKVEFTEKEKINENKVIESDTSRIPIQYDTISSRIPNPQNSSRLHNSDTLEYKLHLAGYQRSHDNSTLSFRRNDFIIKITDNNTIRIIGPLNRYNAKEIDDELNRVIRIIIR